MGRLLGLELHNFKSYKGTINVGFGESNFTSIIGPNGSGKSNMMDAISFVLGVQSSQLRSSTMKDLVYRGLISDEDGQDGNKETSNPSTAFVKAFYQHDGKIVELMRTVTTSGESNYKIDGKTVSYKKYATFLESENILIKAKNFLVFQGDVEQIASQSSLDLTRLFEEVSGSIQYKKEYEELKEKVEKLSRSTAESIKNRRRIHGEMKIYKEAVSKDERYRKQLDKKRSLETYLALWQLFHLENEKKELATKLRESKSLIVTLKNKITNEENNLKRAKTSIIKETTSMTRIKNKLDLKNKEKDGFNAKLMPTKLSQKSAIKRKANIEKRIEGIEKDMERQKEFVKRFENQLSVVSKAKISLEESIKSSSVISDKYKLSDEDLKLYQSLNEKYLSNGGSDFESKLALLINEKQDFEEDHTAIEKRMDQSKSIINEDLTAKCETLDLQLFELTASLNEKNSLHAEKVAEFKKLQSNIESTSNKEYDLNFKLREVLIKLNDLSASQRESAREKQLRENVAMLKRFFPGVHGLVSDLCRPKREAYALAVSTILGKNFDSIVVSSTSVAQDCIAFLKKQRTGSASFIPLDNIEVETAILPIQGNNGCTLTINAVEYDAAYERAMQYVCSDSIICDTLEVAKNMKWKHNIKSKLVTLNGALIHKAGLMTGGVSKDLSNRWDKEEYQSLLSLKDKLVLQIDNYSANSKTNAINARSLESVISVLNADISNLRTQIAQLSRSLEESKLEIKYHENLLLKKYEPQLKDIKDKIENTDKTIQKTEQQKEKLQNEIFATFTTKFGFTIKEYESHSGDIMRKQSKELQQLHKQLLNVENKLQFENDRLITTEKRLDKAHIDLKKTKIELDTWDEKEIELQTEYKLIDENIEQLNSEIENLQKVILAKQREIESIESVVSDETSSLQSAEQQKLAIVEGVDKIDVEKMSIYKNCKITNVNLPVISEITLDKLPVDRVDNDSILISNEITVDYDELPAKYKESGAENIKEGIEKELKNIESVLSDLQPNSKAVEKLDEAEGNFNEADNEAESLKVEERKVLTQFLKLKKKRKELFEKAFDHVSAHLDPIYRELTKNPNSSAELAGGNASLTLDDEDEPYNAGIKYHATPPLKRFKDMEYLSGGEKTVAALALLFAINSFHPSPFFVLDEIDAALDVLNVEKIATYIRKQGNPNLQFIVISLKNTMFEKSEALVGIYRHQEENSSQVVTLNLNNYVN